MAKAHERLVGDQFGPQAQAYVDSEVHAAGEDLEALDRIAREAVPAHAIDLGTGGGHVAYLLARHARSVTACDLSPAMLAAVAATAQQRGLANIATAEAPAEDLPFADGTFDFLATRYSAHHWRDVDRGLREARRVLTPGAQAVFMDACSPGTPLLDTHLQAIELLRDTSHARDYSLPEWTRALTQAGFGLRSARMFRIRLDFATWTARMRTPADNVRVLRALQAGASSAVQAHFAIEGDGSFMLDVAMIQTVAA